MQIGLGFDIHRIRPARKGHILLAGLKIAAPYRIEAHSDGDFVFHALADAIGSALGLGDIGEQFPPGLAKTRGMNSRLILDHYLSQLKKTKGRLLCVSLVVVAEKPKLGFYREEIRRSLAQALHLMPAKVGLTFKTFEALEPLAQKSVACWANCLIR